MNKSMSIVIADVQEMIRDSLHKNLSQFDHYNISSDASDGYTALRNCQNLSADILVIGQSFVRPNCLKVIEKAKQNNPAIGVVVISDDSNTATAFTFFSAGAIAVVPRNAKVVDLINAVRSAELGYACVSGECIAEFTALRRNVTRTGNMYGLSPREMEVVQACASGASTKEVAHQLAISVRTVEAHRNAIYRKTDCQNVEDIMNMAQTL